MESAASLGRARATVFHSRQSNVIDYVRGQSTWRLRMTLRGGEISRASTLPASKSSLHARLPHNQQVSASYAAIHGGARRSAGSNGPLHLELSDQPCRLSPGWANFGAHSGPEPNRRRSAIGEDPYAVWGLRP